MTKMTHEQKVKMARKMMTTKERSVHVAVVNGKQVFVNAVSIFNSVAWNLRAQFRAAKEARRQRIAEGNRNAKKVEKEMAKEAAEISKDLDITLEDKIVVKE